MQQDASEGVKLLFSETCRDWAPSSPEEALRTGFYRKEGTTVYVDKVANAFVTLEGKSAPFLSDASSQEWAFTATASGFNGMVKERSLGTAKPNGFTTLRDLLQASEELTAQTQNTNRWISILLESETKFAVVLQGDLCAVAPQARYVTCSAQTKECSFFPRAFNFSADPDSEGKAARQCLVDLKMGAPEKVQPLAKACEYFQSSAYEELQRRALEVSMKCGDRAVKAVRSLPNLKRIEEACLSIPQTLFELTGSH